MLYRIIQQILFVLVIYHILLCHCSNHCHIHQFSKTPHHKLRALNNALHWILLSNPPCSVAMISIVTLATVEDQEPVCSPSGRSIPYTLWLWRPQCPGAHGDQKVLVWTILSNWDSLPHSYTMIGSMANYLLAQWGKNVTTIGVRLIKPQNDWIPCV